MDELERRLAAAGQAWRDSQPSPPEMGPMVDRLRQARGRPASRWLAVLGSGAVAVALLALLMQARVAPPPGASPSPSPAPSVAATRSSPAQPQLVCWPDVPGLPATPPPGGCEAEEAAALAAVLPTGLEVSKVEVLLTGWPCGHPFGNPPGGCVYVPPKPAAYVFFAATSAVAAVAFTSAPDGSLTGRVVATQSPPVYPTPAPGLVRHFWGDATFVTPIGWHIALPAGRQGEVSPVMFLSSDPITGPCPSGAVGGDTCYRAPGQLSAGGTLIELDDGGPFPRMLSSTSPDLGAYSCPKAGGTTGTATWIPHTFFYGLACFRGPNLAESLAAFTAFANSWSFMPPPWDQLMTACLPAGRHPVDATCPF